MTDDNIIRVAGYCRVSTEKADQTNSFAAQQRYFRTYIARQPGWALCEIYADEGITGTSTRKRAEFNRMIEDARLGRFHLIVTKEVSRFSRNILDTIAYTRELKRLGIGVLFMNDGINTLEPDAELRLSIMASIAQEESRKTSARVKWGQTRQMERGVVFGHSLLGYDVRNGVLSINPEGAGTVQLIFRKYGEEKKSTAVIARELRAAGYRTAAGSTEWSAGHILKILKNEKYVGDLVQKKSFTPDYLTHEKKINHGEEALIVMANHHPPIIDRPLWDTVQAELRRRSRSAGARSCSAEYVFSGKITCGECGAAFVPRCKYRKDGSFYRRWGCQRAASAGKPHQLPDGSSAGCAVGRMLRDDTAEKLVKIALCSLLFEREEITRTVCTLAAEAIDWEENRLSDGEERIRTEIDRTEKKKEGVLDAFFSGEITPEEMQTMRARYDQQLAELRQRLIPPRELECPRDIHAIREMTAAVLRGDVVSDALNRSLVERITVFGDRHIELKLSGLPLIWHFTD